jgi:hypothetical protein
METLEAKPKSINAREEDTYVVFMAFRQKKFTGCKVSPLPDRTGKHWTGQGHTGYFEDLSFNDKQNMAYVITPTTYIHITHGKSLDMTNPVDEANWKWIQKHPYVALTQEASATNRDAVVYVENRKKDAEDRVTKTANIDRARYLVRYDTSADTLAAVAGALDMPQPHTASYNVQLDYVLNCITDGQADMVLTLLGQNDKQGGDIVELREAMALFFNLKRNKVIDKYAGGIYRWNGENGVIIGTTEKTAFEFLMNPKNVQTIEALKGELSIRVGR